MVAKKSWKSLRIATIMEMKMEILHEAMVLYCTCRMHINELGACQWKKRINVLFLSQLPTAVISFKKKRCQAEAGIGVVESMWKINECGERHTPPQNGQMPKTEINCTADNKVVVSWEVFKEQTNKGHNQER